MGPTSSAPEVTAALASAVRRMGPALGGEPRRVQACLNDELGMAARSHRGAVDAIVIAADEGIPAEIVAGRLERRNALRRLAERGLDDRTANAAIEAWHASFAALTEPLGSTQQLQDTSPTPPSAATEIVRPGVPVSPAFTLLPDPPGVSAVAPGSGAGERVATVAPGRSRPFSDRGN